MAADAIDIGLDGGTDMALIVKGAPMMTIAPLSGAPLEMVISVKADSPIKSVADLKGRKIAVTGAGTLTGWITRELVRSLGWSDRDVTYVISSNVAASRALLQTGEIDALTTDLSTTLESERLGKERLLYSYGDLVKDFHMQVIPCDRQGDRVAAAGGARVYGGMARNRRLRQGAQGRDAGDHPEGPGFPPGCAEPGL